MIWLLDANILIHARNGHPGVRARLNAAGPQATVTSIVVVAELMFGAEKSARAEQNKVEIEAQLGLIEVLPLTREITNRFGKIKSAVAAQGKSKGDFDLVIAATAIEHGATLVTDDKALLAGDIPGITVENWVR